jgi:uncharacterized protein
VCIFMEKADPGKKLSEEITEKKDLLISYSGGVDSTLLAVIAQRTLPEKVKCVLLDAPIVPRRAIKEAVETAVHLGLSCDVVPFPIMENEEFRANPTNRCYICKKASAKILRNQAEELGISNIADGINASDLREYRPGLKASEEEGLIHPLLAAGCEKTDIRRIAKDYGIPIWNKPSSACISSRFPYGEEITDEKLQMIEQAENFMQDMGFSQFRVRLHGKIARIELVVDEFEKAISIRERIVEVLNSYGFSYITLDLKGYRSGSMDEVL